MARKRFSMYAAVALMGLALAGCGGGGGDTPSNPSNPSTPSTPETPAAPAPTPVSVKATSYENDKKMNIGATVLPGNTNTAAFIRGDFARNGKMGLFMAYNPTPASATDPAVPGRFEFYDLKDDGTFVKNDTMLVDGSVGCNNPRKAIVADFNGDKRPDVFVACHGIDYVGSGYPGEYSYVLLSLADGKYTSRKVGAGNEFSHGATAADVDGDGDVDVLVAKGDGLQLFLNDGQGVFTVDNTKVPLGLSTKTGYYTVELVDTDLDGTLELLVGGHESNIPAAPTLVVKTPFSGTPTSTVIPTVAGEEVVLDFTVEQSYIYLVRTAPAYGTNAVQKVWVGDVTVSNKQYEKLATQDPLLKLLPTSLGLVNDNGKYPLTIVY